MLLDEAHTARLQALRQALVVHGISPERYRVLEALAGIHSAPLRWLAKQCRVSPPAVGRMLLAMEVRGLVERAPPVLAGHARHVWLVDGGHKLLKLCRKRVSEVEWRMLSGLSAIGAEELRLTLQACIAALGAVVPNQD
jgi:DNA-binding MarR family transcriptional regulator